MNTLYTASSRPSALSTTSVATLENLELNAALVPGVLP